MEPWENARFQTKSHGTGKSEGATYEYDGVQHDYTRKQNLVWQQVFLPVAAPAEWQNREIWNVCGCGDS